MVVLNALPVLLHLVTSALLRDEKSAAKACESLDGFVDVADVALYPSELDKCIDDDLHSLHVVLSPEVREVEHEHLHGGPGEHPVLAHLLPRYLGLLALLLLLSPLVEIHRPPLRCYALGHSRRTLASKLVHDSRDRRALPSRLPGEEEGGAAGKNGSSARLRRRVRASLVRKISLGLVEPLLQHFGHILVHGSDGVLPGVTDVGWRRQRKRLARLPLSPGRRRGGSGLESVGQRVVRHVPQATELPKKGLNMERLLVHSIPLHTFIPAEL
mmetsp:Transcript_107879/g.230370  ORF Transcript_107879/g.230370 Transcript_107879/m.230370 type:complete len:271 (+) Transcript_107879:999-1811(+)